MKIAIIGSPVSVDKVYDCLSVEYSQIEFIKCSRVMVADLLEITQNIEKEVDGIHLTGVGVYSFLEKHIQLKTPTVYTARGQLGIIKALWQLQKDGNSIEEMKIGLDVMEERDIMEVIDEFSINIQNFYFQKYDPELSEEHFLRNYLDKYKSGTINCVVTGFGRIYNYFKEKGFPAYLIQPTNFEIREEFEKLLHLIQMEKIKSSLLCVQIIKPVPLAINLSKKNSLTYEKKFKSDITEYAKEMNSALEITPKNEYLIITNRRAALNSENLNTINHILNDKYQGMLSIGMGVGEGPTLRQSEKNARKSLKTSLKEGKNNIYFYDGVDVKGPLFSPKEISYKGSVGPTTVMLSKKTGISSFYIEKIKAISKKIEKNSFTSVELAHFLNVSERSANRILRKLIDNGYALDKNFEISEGAGRPRRIIEIKF